jgi:integrase/recombinase XerD
LRLYTPEGARKYVTAGERQAFLRAAEEAERRVRTLCMTLAYTGCRLSEALALTADRVDLAAGVVVFESLKKRRRGLYRAVPVPPALLDALDLVHTTNVTLARCISLKRNGTEQSPTRGVFFSHQHTCLAQGKM